MGESYATTISDENMSTETPNLVTEKLKDLIITDGSVSTTSTVITTNGEITNTAPIIKQKFPKLAVKAGKPYK